jgi:hypothetical protein
MKKDARAKFLIGFPCLKIEMLLAGNQNDALKKHTRWWRVPARHQTDDMVALVRTPPNTRYGGMGPPPHHQQSTVPKYFFKLNEQSSLHQEHLNNLYIVEVV